MKVHYEIDLTNLAYGAPIEVDMSLRRIGQSDHGALARLMLDAYVGTIDFDDETLDDASNEVGWWLRAAPMLDHSLVLERDGHLLSAVLVSERDLVPFIAYVMTDPDHKRTGLADVVVRACLHSLRSTGGQRVEFAITRGNTASERLFARVGARPVAT